MPVLMTIWTIFVEKSTKQFSRVRNMMKVSVLLRNLIIRHCHFRSIFGQTTLANFFSRIDITQYIVHIKTSLNEALSKISFNYRFSNCD